MLVGLEVTKTFDLNALHKDRNTVTFSNRRKGCNKEGLVITVQVPLYHHHKSSNPLAPKKWMFLPMCSVYSGTEHQPCLQANPRMCLWWRSLQGRNLPAPRSDAGPECDAGSFLICRRAIRIGPLHECTLCRSSYHLKYISVSHIILIGQKHF